MEEEKSKGFWGRFRANRYAFESLLFEHQAVHVKNDLWTGLLVVLIIWAASVYFLYRYVCNVDHLLSAADSTTYTAILHYISEIESHGFWVLLKPDFTSLLFSPPFYYLLYIPVLKFITPDLGMAMVIVNSLFLLILCLFPFLAVRDTYGSRSGLIASIAIMAFPFVTEAARHPSPDIALIAMVTGFYASYICYREFVDNKWSYAMGAFFALGFYTHSYFWIYTIPLWQAVLTGITNNVNGARFFKTVGLGIILNAPWYLFFIISKIINFSNIRGEYTGWLTLFNQASYTAGLPLMALGLLSLLWMYFVTYKPYEKRKVLINWFLYSYVILTFVLCAHNPALMFPAFISFAFMIAVMTPFRLNRFIFTIIAVLALLNNFTSVKSVKVGKYFLFGASNYESSVIPYKELFSKMDVTLSNLPSDGSKKLISVFSEKGNINADSIRFAFKKNYPLAEFVNSPKLPYLSDVVINEISPEGKSSESFTAFKQEKEFNSLYMLKDVVSCYDLSKVEIYSRIPMEPQTFRAGRYPLGKVTIGHFVASNVSFTIEKENAQNNTYSGVIFAPSGAWFDGDIYGMKLAVDGVKLVNADGKLSVASLENIKVLTAKISSYAIENVIQKNVGALENVAVSLEDNQLVLDADLKGRKFNAVFTVTLPEKDVIEINPISFSYMGINFPVQIKFMLKLFSYRMNISQIVPGLQASSVKMNMGMMEIN